MHSSHVGNELPLDILEPPSRLACPKVQFGPGGTQIPEIGPQHGPLHPAGSSGWIKAPRLSDNVPKRGCELVHCDDNAVPASCAPGGEGRAAFAIARGGLIPPSLNASSRIILLAFRSAHLPISN
jgi:hypothetical protein